MCILNINCAIEISFQSIHIFLEVYLLCSENYIPKSQKIERKNAQKLCGYFEEKN